MASRCCWNVDYNFYFFYFFILFLFRTSHPDGHTIRTHEAPGWNPNFNTMLITTGSRAFYAFDWNFVLLHLVFLKNLPVGIKRYCPFLLLPRSRISRLRTLQPSRHHQNQRYHSRVKERKAVRNTQLPLGAWTLLWFQRFTLLFLLLKRNFKCDWEIEERKHLEPGHLNMDSKFTDFIVFKSFARATFSRINAMRHAWTITLDSRSTVWAFSTD